MNKFLFLLPIFAILVAFTPANGPEIPADIQALLQKNGCIACHNVSQKIVGPAWTAIAEKKYSAKRIMQLVKKPEPTNWPGYAPMLAQTNVPEPELKKIANWLSKLK